MKPSSTAGSVKDGARSSSPHAKEDELRMYLEPFTKLELETLFVELFCPTSGSKLPKHTKKDPPPTFEKLMARLTHDTKWCKLFVHQLAYTTTSADLEKFYGQFGRIKEAVVLVDKNGNSKGYGFVTFSTADEAMAAATIHKRKIDGRVTHCALAWKGNPKKQEGGDDSVGIGGSLVYEGEPVLLHSHPRSRPHAHGMRGPPRTRMSPMGMVPRMQPMPTSTPPTDGFRGPIRLTKLTSGASSTGSTGARELAADRRLFVHSLAWRTGDDELRRAFSLYGEIEEAAVIREKKTGKSKGYGFVTFVSCEGAARALEEPDKVINERMTHCNYACERSGTGSDAPRGGGGPMMHGPPHGGLFEKPRVLKSLSADSSLRSRTTAALEPVGGRPAALRHIRSVESEIAGPGSVWEMQRTRPLLRDRTRSAASATSSARSGEDAAAIGEQLAEARAHTPSKRGFYRAPTSASTLADRRAALSAQAHARLRAAPPLIGKAGGLSLGDEETSVEKTSDASDGGRAASRMSPFESIPEKRAVVPKLLSGSGDEGLPGVTSYYKAPEEFEAENGDMAADGGGATADEMSPQNIVMRAESDLFDQFFLDARLEADEIIDMGTPLAADEFHDGKGEARERSHFSPAAPPRMVAVPASERR
jgi:RNA recognition motif-containing protein